MPNLSCPHLFISLRSGSDRGLCAPLESRPVWATLSCLQCWNAQTLVSSWGYCIFIPACDSMRACSCSSASMFSRFYWIQIFARKHSHHLIPFDSHTHTCNPHSPLIMPLCSAHGLNGHVISDGGCTCPGDFSKAFGESIWENRREQERREQEWRGESRKGDERAGKQREGDETR